MTTKDELVELQIAQARTEERFKSIEEKLDGLKGDLKDIKDTIHKDNSWYRSSMFKIISVLLVGLLGGGVGATSKDVIVDLLSSPAVASQQPEVTP